MKKSKFRELSYKHRFLRFFFNHLYILLIFLSFGLIISWFSPQQLITGGEEGLFFHNPDISIRLFASPWYEVVTGMPMPVLLPRISLLFIPYLFTNVLSVPPWISQAIIMFLILSSGLVSMYGLAKLFLKDKSHESTFIIISLFYLFNLYTLSQIYGRLLFTGIILWGYLPLFLLLYIKWIESRKYVYLIFLLVSSILFSYTYGMPSNIIVLWFIPVVWTIINIIREKNKVQIFLGACLAGFTWFITNIWWIYPYIKLSQSAFTSVADYNASLDSLIGVSNYFPTSQIILLRQIFLFQDTYHGWYNQTWVIGLSILIAIVVIYGVISSKKRKFWSLFLITLLIGWFVSKGTNPPFGKELFDFLFSQFNFLQVFRNSYEKFGIILLLSYSFFFGVGIENIIKRITVFKKIKMLILIGAVTLFCFVPGWPLLTGDVFGAKISNTKVTVPDSYSQANTYINSRGEGKILMLPLIPGDGIKYIWEKGDYQGIEPSEVLFDNPAISKIVRLELIDSKYTKFYNAIINDDSYSEYFREMNIRYIVLHNDIESKAVGASSSAEMKLFIQKDNTFKFLKTYGDLDIYEFNDPRARMLFEIFPDVDNKIDYKKLSNTHYIVYVSHMIKPYSIIFKETFHPLWTARVDNTIVGDHYIAYEYANGWKINKKGTYTIDIRLKIWPWE